MAVLERHVEGALTAGLIVSAALLVAGLALGQGVPLRAGLLLLMFTPVARVIVMTIALALDRDWLFASVSLFILGVLASSIWVAVHI